MMLTQNRLDEENLMKVRTFGFMIPTVLQSGPNYSHQCRWSQRQQVSSSDLMSPLCGKYALSLILLKSFRRRMPTYGQCHRARRSSLGTVVRLRSRFNNLRLAPCW
jgi:hypothetical protein